MPLRSMTGMGQASGEVPSAAGSVRVRIEIVAVNSRFLECAVHTPWGPQMQRSLEQRLRGALGRGRIELRVNVEPGGDREQPSERGGPAAAAELDGLMRELASIHRAAQEQGLELRPASAWELRTALRRQVPGSDDRDGPAPEDPALVTLIDQALASLLSMRRDEGLVLERELRSQATGLQTCLASVETRRVAMVPQLAARLEQRIAQVLNGEQGARIEEVGQERVAQELAVLLARGDVQEEVVRAQAHLHQVLALLDEEPKVGQGKRLGFLCQELGREWSTMGAKIADPEAAAVVVTAKSHIERIREQAQNVE